MSSTNHTLPNNNLIDGNIHHGTIGNVADVLDLLSCVTDQDLTSRPRFGLYLLLSQCSDALRYVAGKLSNTDSVDSDGCSLRETC